MTNNLHNVRSMMISEPIEDLKLLKALEFLNLQLKKNFQNSLY